MVVQRRENCLLKDFSLGTVTTGCMADVGSILKKCTGYAKFRKSKLSMLLH